MKVRADPASGLPSLFSFDVERQKGRHPTREAPLLQRLPSAETLPQNRQDRPRRSMRMLAVDAS